MKIGVIIQARTGSKRYPRKIYKDINGKYTLQRVLEGVTSAQIPHKIILAMPYYDEKEFQQRFDQGDFHVDDRFSTYFGSPDDLLTRYFSAARKYGIDLIVRVTADCPLIQGYIIDEMLVHYLKFGLNTFLGNNTSVSTTPYPDGIDAEIFPYWMLSEAYLKATSPSDREHVCPYMYSGIYKIERFLNIRPNSMMSTKHLDVSFDTDEDYQLILKIAQIYDACGDINKALEQA